MKMNLNDPNLTAYALGELSEPERSIMALAVADSPEAQAYVREVQEMARLLQGEFRDDLRQGAAKQLSIFPLPQEGTFFSDARWGSLGVASLLAIGGIVAAVMLSGRTDTDGLGKKPAPTGKRHTDGGVYAGGI